jgi:hypothetical protein
MFELLNTEPSFHDRSSSHTTTPTTLTLARLERQACLRTDEIIGGGGGGGRVAGVALEAEAILGKRSPPIVRLEVQVFNFHFYFLKKMKERQETNSSNSTQKESKHVVLIFLQKP